VVALIVAFRRRHPGYGPKKLLRILQRQQRRSDWPAVSTAALILQRAGLTRALRRVRRHAPTPVAPAPRLTAPNELWNVDFKGQFRTGDARYCYPLTLTDAFSRYLLDCYGQHGTTEAETRRRFERAFQRYGVPRAIRSDNGVPFASSGFARLSRLSVWWLRLGIQWHPIRPGHPEENGAHEYMHRVLKRETARPPAATGAQQQVRFEAFRDQYNHVRPHEGLGQVVPASLYRRSPRSLPARLPPVEYPGHFEVRRITDGTFSWHSHTVFLTRALTGEYIGFEEVDDGVWTVYFCHRPIGRFDERTHQLTETHERRGSSG
jgi:transposase InsO family protein